jgi:hypothetical protein
MGVPGVLFSNPKGVAADRVLYKPCSLRAGRRNIPIILPMHNKDRLKCLNAEEKKRKRDLPGPGL